MNPAVLQTASFAARIHGSETRSDSYSGDSNPPLPVHEAGRIPRCLAVIDGNDLRVAVWIYAWNSTPSKIRTWIKGFVGPYAKSITPTEYKQDNIFFELSPEPLDDTGIRR